MLEIDGSPTDGVSCGPGRVRRPGYGVGSTSPARASWRAVPDEATHSIKAFPLSDPQDPQEANPPAPIRENQRGSSNTTISMNGEVKGTSSGHVTAIGGQVYSPCEAWKDTTAQTTAVQTER